ncbi:hypothetical protein ACE1ET_19605 [Saccharicrinis sp. FJH62]|uniref:hypothetical protein n=1 Tax=Saccharicrinis sp. FJH62 TaxID=3344657 RepID=UPI0035D42B01
MRKYAFLLVVVTTLWGFSADNLSNYSDYSPVLMERSNLEKSIHSVDPVTMENPGKIYIKDSLLFIVEKFKGVHIINDYNPSSPANLAFITIPGVVDIAVKGNILFADNAVDLVSVNISDLNNVQEVKRVRNVFPELYHPELRYIPDQFRKGHRPANTVIVNWIKRES